MKSLSDIIAAAGTGSFYDIIIKAESEKSKRCEDDLRDEMRRRLEVMKQAAQKGIANSKLSASGLSGGNAGLLKSGRAPELLGTTGKKAMLIAAAVAEENARMGKIVAAPTAGSCGILPGVLLAVADEYKIGDDGVVSALFCAGGIGEVISERASLSGADSGCQAECGSAAAMAAGAVAEMLGGDAETVGNAAALALKAVMGLVCDPVAGLVEVPCVKRNISGAVNALSAAMMALSGIRSEIPPDEVIDAMKKVGSMLDPSLRETSCGGLAATPTARLIEKRLNDR